MYTYEKVLNSSTIEAAAVSFPHDTIKVSGYLYLPQGQMPEGGWPAVVIGHPTGGVKEQTAGVYAVKLAERGIATLTFDASYQGESGGEPRYLEDPSVRRYVQHWWKFCRVAKVPSQPLPKNWP